MLIVIENGKHRVEKPGDIHSFNNLQNFAITSVVIW